MADTPLSAARVLDPALAADPDHPALVTRTQQLSYAQLDDAASRAAHAWWDLGVRAGDRVGVSLPNEADVVSAFHGAMRLGAVWVGINQGLATPEKRFLVADAGCTVVLVDDAPDPDAEPDLGARLVTRRAWLEVAGAATATPWTRGDPDPLGPAGIAYTSGTTGRPKGAVHSQHNLMMPGSVLVATRGYGPDLRKGDCFAFTILNMVVLTTLLTSQAGGTAILMDRTDAVGIAEWIRSARITLWNGAPAQLHGLATHPDVTPDDLESLEEIWTGGGDCPEVIQRAFADRFGLAVHRTYGLSEAPAVVAIDERVPRGGSPRHGVGGSGRPLPHLQVRIIDADGHGLERGDTGQICVAPADHRYRPMLGYLNRPEATAQTLVDGELRTGDIGYLDDDGFVHVRDRLSLLIIRGGANVYPAEVERVFAEFDGVVGSAVIGIPDERLGERVAALVEVAEGANIDHQALVDHLRTNLAPYKVPEQVEYVDRLPRNAMGKIVRDGLGELLAPGR